jgi:autotransporter-associated beta strand protein
MREGSVRIVQSAAFLVVAGLLAGTPAQAGTATWDGDGTTATDDVTFGTAPVDTVPLPDPIPEGFVAPAPLPFKLWTTGDNWVGGVPAGAGDDAIFGEPAPGGSMKVAIRGNVQVQTITLNSPAIGVTQGFTTNVNYEFDPYSGPGNKITLGAGGSITQNAVTGASNSTPSTFRVPIDLAGSASITSNQASYLVMRGPITGLAATRETLTINATSNSIVFSPISGNLDVVKNGGGALTLGIAAGETSPASGQGTYLGNTAVTLGTLISKTHNVLPVTTTLTMGQVGGPGTATDFRMDAANQTLAGLVSVPGSAATPRILGGAGALATSVLTLNNATYNRYAGTFGTGGTGNFAFTKTGAGAFTLAGASNAYTGATNLNQGTFEIEAAGNLGGTTGTVTINGGRAVLNHTASAGMQRATTVTSGTIGGSGRIHTPISIGANATISPGGDVDTSGVTIETVATQNYSLGLTFAPDGAYAFDVTTPTTSDLITTNALTITATPADPFAININNLGVAPGTALSRTITTSTAAIAGFNPSNFIVTGGGAGSVSVAGNSLVLDFTTLQSVYWDINGTVAGAGGATPAGSWDSTTANFNTDPLGAAAGSALAATNGAHNVTFSAGSDATGTYTVTLDGTRTAASVNIEEGNVTLTGGSLATGAFNVAPGASGAVASTLVGGVTGKIVKSGAGTLMLSAANTHANGTTVSAGSLVVAHAGALGAGSLSIANGASAVAQTGLATAVSVASVSTTGTGKLDLSNNAFVIKNSTLATVTAQIVAGYNNGDFLGAGITSSTAANDPNFLTAIGYASNLDAAYVTFEGVGGLDDGDVLVKYTYYGDADLTGSVDLDDFNLFLAGYQDPANVPQTWIYGDFDYTGSVDLDDFNLFLAAYQANGAPLSALAGGIEMSSLSAGDQQLLLAAVVAVPEPGTLGILGVASLGVLSRRRRRDA